MIDIDYARKNIIDMLNSSTYYYNKTRNNSNSNKIYLDLWCRDIENLKVILESEELSLYFFVYILTEKAISKLNHDISYDLHFIEDNSDSFVFSKNMTLDECRKYYMNMFGLNSVSYSFLEGKTSDLSKEVREMCFNVNGMSYKNGKYLCSFYKGNFFATSFMKIYNILNDEGILNEIFPVSKQDIRKISNFL